MSLDPAYGWPEFPTGIYSGVILHLPRGTTTLGAISRVQLTLGWDNGAGLSVTIGDLKVVQAASDGTLTVSTAASQSNGQLAAPIVLEVSTTQTVIPLYSIRNTVFPN